MLPPTVSRWPGLCSELGLFESSTNSSLSTPTTTNPMEQAESWELPTKQDPSLLGSSRGCCVATGVGMHSLWGTLVPAAGLPAQQGGTGPSIWWWMGTGGGGWGLHRLVLCWRRLQQCTETLLEAVIHCLHVHCSRKHGLCVSAHLPKLILWLI